MSRITSITQNNCGSSWSDLLDFLMLYFMLGLFGTPSSIYFEILYLDTVCVSMDSPGPMTGPITACSLGVLVLFLNLDVPLSTCSV